MKTPCPCDECDGGTLHSIIEDYDVLTQDGNKITVPGVKMIRCDKCGETTIPAASSRYISEFQAQATEQLTKKELHTFFEQSDLTQKDYAEALGLGEKTFHRWLKGTQVVSRSMGYYLRAMHHFPEVFEWVKQRDWRTPKRAPAKRGGQAQPIFAALERRTTIMIEFQRNPAQGLVLGAVHHR